VDFHTGDNLIFVREDFLQLGRSAIATITSYRSGKSISSPLPWPAMAQQHPMKVGNLDSVLQNPASYKVLARFRRRPPPASRSQAARVGDAASAELDEKGRLS